MTRRSDDKNAGSARSRRKRLAIRLVSLSIGALIVTALALPYDDRSVEVIGPKLGALEARSEPYDVVMIGSSFVYRQIDPERFDRVLRAKGHDLTSFNLGGPAMRMLEAIELLRKVSRDPKTRPRWVLLGSYLDDEPIPVENLRKPRTIYWHTPGATLMACRWSLLVRGPKKTRTAATLEAGRHLIAGTLRALRIGSLSPSLRALVHPKPPTEDGPDANGYFGFPERHEDLPLVWRRLNRELHEKKDAYQERSAPTPRRSHPAKPPGSYRYDVMARAKEIADRYGVRLVFLFPPTLTNASASVATIETYGLGDALDFARPDLYPELFALENRMDWSHVNHRGAMLYSERVAEAFSELISPADDLESGEPTTP